jgi:RNA polymerase sigma-70 factor (ECF subfamily)
LKRLEEVRKGVSFTSTSSPLRRMPASAYSKDEGLLDTDSRSWIDALRSQGGERERAISRLHELLLGAARYEVTRRHRTLLHIGKQEQEDLALQSADDALAALLEKLDQFRGASRFTTWAFKFALLEAAVKVRRRAWESREIPIEPDHWLLSEDGAPRPEADAEMEELFRVLGVAIREVLTLHQREVLVAVALNGVPIDVLAERLGTTRGALYKTLHDARRKLRSELCGQGFSLTAFGDKEGR